MFDPQVGVKFSPAARVLTRKMASYEAQSVTSESATLSTTCLYAASVCVCEGGGLSGMGREGMGWRGSERRADCVCREVKTASEYCR